MMKSVAKGLIWSLVAGLGLMAMQSPAANAGVTCKVMPSWCPPPPDGGGSSTVPEPATLTVLALGACAAGLAAARRRRK